MRETVRDGVGEHERKCEKDRNGKRIKNSKKSRGENLESILRVITAARKADMIKRICSKRIRDTWEIQGNCEVVRERCMTEGKEREQKRTNERARERKIGENWRFA